MAFGKRHSWHAKWFAIVLWLACTALAQEGQPPLPQDTGVNGLKQVLIRLHTTARLLHTTAHPDDEDGGMLTMESRGKGAHVTLLTLNRGEGGQNRTGSGLFDELGVLRTLELLAADRYYAAEQRFTRVVDFGYSKNSAETFEKWRGHDSALADMVRVIRTERPDVIVSRFQGASRDGHGHHEAAGILTKEAFRAAADPARFPEQIKEGLRPWQAKKLYVDNVHEGEDYSVMFDTAVDAPLLGMSYQAFAMQGLKSQLSQGAGTWSLAPGPHYSRYRLVDSAIPNVAGADGHEKDFFDGLDTSLPGLARTIGKDADAIPGLSAALKLIAQKVTEADAAVSTDAAASAKPLLEAHATAEELIEKVNRAGISEESREFLLSRLEEKRQQLDDAARLAIGLRLEATAELPSGSEIVVPGQTFTVKAKLTGAAAAQEFALDVPAKWKTERTQQDATSATFKVTVPQNASYSRPYFHRADERETVYTIEDASELTQPVVPPPIHVRVTYEAKGLKGTLRSPAQAELAGNGKTERRNVMVAPAFSVIVDPATLVVPVGREAPVEMWATVRSNIGGVREATLQILGPAPWRIEPAVQNVTLERPGSEQRLKFYIFPDTATEGRFQLKAKLSYNGQDFEQGYSTVSREDLGRAYYYQPANERVAIVRVKIPDNYIVGYIMGAGDEIPTVLREVGLNVKMLTPQELAEGDLQHYSAIVLGIRAYDVRDDVRRYNPRLMQYVEKGGTLLLQYNASLQEFNAGKFTPSPLEIGRDRVSVEEAPVEVFDGKDFLWNEPNEVTLHDFDGWVQERGLYFAKTWGGRFQSLLSSHDPGEPPLAGGLLRAYHGKGTYIYTGYSFFRQLPNGVPGAIRLFVNLLSAHQ